MFPILFGILTQAHAKDLSETTVGIGVNNWYHQDIPALSVRTMLPLSSQSDSSLGQLHLEGLIGFNNDPSSRTKTFIGGRVLTAVVVEDNLNLLAGAGAGFGWVNQTAVLQFQPARWAAHRRLWKRLPQLVALLLPFHHLKASVPALW